MWAVLFPEAVRGRGAVALLLVRVVMGLAFILHGWPKIQRPMSWMPPEAPVPGLLQACAAVAEFGGGFALILGLLTPLAALGLAITMFVATFLVHLPQGHPFVPSKPGDPSFELAAVYLALSLLFLLLGPGAYSIDAWIFRPRNRHAPTLPGQ